MAWTNNKLTKLFGIKYPIVQGPFGGNFSTVELCATVSNLGGLGSFGLNSYDKNAILAINKSIQELTVKPYVLNLWVPLKNDPANNFNLEDFLSKSRLGQKVRSMSGIELPAVDIKTEKSFESQIEAILEACPPIVSFIFGVPEKSIIDALRKRGILVMACATTLEEAIVVENAGLDIVIASGISAGGHRPAFLNPLEIAEEDTAELVKKICKEIRIPIIGAGGISDGTEAYKILKAGASAVQMGTAFLATQESNATDEHKLRLREKEIKTMLSNFFTGRPARMLKNKLATEMKELTSDEIAPYPYQSLLLRPLREKLIKDKEFDSLAFYSGQPSSRLVHETATKLFGSVVTEVNKMYDTAESI